MMKFEECDLLTQLSKIKSKLQEAIRFIEDASGINNNYNDFHGALMTIAGAYNMLVISRKHWPPIKNKLKIEYHQGGKCHERVESF